MADIASASTTDIGAQNTNFLRVTGNTTITSFGANFKGPRFLVFEGAVTLTNSSTLVLPGGANITTSAGDVLIVIPGATLGTADKWIVAAYQASTGYLKSTNPSYTGTLTGGTGVVNLGSGQIYKDTSGNVGIGETTPLYRLHIKMPSSGVGAGFRYTGATNNPGLFFSVDESTSISTINATGTNFGILALATGGIERSRIDSSGNTLVGTQINLGGKLMVAADSTGATYPVVVNNTADGSGNQTIIELRRTSSQVGSISSTNSTTSYNTSSDYRLKNTIAPMTGALAKVALLKPCTYKWNIDGSDGQGFIAHELAEVEPGCVTGEKDAVDAEGKPKYQGIDVSFLVATLTAAIQEQQFIINALAARVEKLETA
jgi:hypothetical protein